PNRDQRIRVETDRGITQRTRQRVQGTHGISCAKRVPSTNLQQTRDLVLRASEVTGLRVSDIDLKRGTIYCRRAKNSRSSLHPLKPDEAAALDKVLLQRKSRASDYVFQSERAGKLSRSAFWRVVAQTGERGR